MYIRLLWQLDRLKVWFGIQMLDSGVNHADIAKANECEFPQKKYIFKSEFEEEWEATEKKGEEHIFKVKRRKEW